MITLDSLFIFCVSLTLTIVAAIFAGNLLILLVVKLLRAKLRKVKRC
jgi:hypothetical protein